MHAAAALFAAGQRALSPELRRDIFGASGARLFRDIVGVLPGRAAGDGYWEPMPWRAALRKDLRMVVAVRAGDVEDDAAWACVDRDPIHALPSDGGARVRHMLSVLHGADILDLLAFSLAMDRAPRRLTGMAEALGVGADGLSAVTLGPVTLCRTWREWVRSLAALPCMPLGEPAEQQRLIRTFPAGVVCQDLAHGVAVERMLKRELPAVPPIAVLAA